LHRTGVICNEAHMNIPTFPPLSAVVGSVLPTPVADIGAKSERLEALIPPVAAGRGVLDGAFAVLDALAHADEGLGLTALARASGLAKTSVHRLAEQLVTLGAVQCVEHRYYVGPLMLRIGQRWQPDPLLRRCAQAPVHSLAVQSHAMRRCGSCRNSDSAMSVPLCHTAIPTCPSPPTPNRSPAPPPDAFSMRLNPLVTSRFLTAGPDGNGAASASRCAIRVRQ
jgi:hypothetical protein